MGTPLQPLVGSGSESTGPMLEWGDWAGPSAIGPAGIGRGMVVGTACIGSEDPQVAPGGCELGPAGAPAGLLVGPLLVGVVGSRFLFGRGFEYEISVEEGIHQRGLVIRGESSGPDRDCLSRFKTAEATSGSSKQGLLELAI